MDPSKRTESFSLVERELWPHSEREWVIFYLLFLPSSLPLLNIIFINSFLLQCFLCCDYSSWNPQGLLLCPHYFLSVLCGYCYLRVSFNLIITHIQEIHLRLQSIAQEKYLWKIMALCFRYTNVYTVRTHFVLLHMNMQLFWYNAGKGNEQTFHDLNNFN